jgi:hypothetical protein
VPEDTPATAGLDVSTLKAAGPFKDTVAVCFLGSGLRPSISATAACIRDAGPSSSALVTDSDTRFTFDRSACEDANITTKKANIKVMKSA